MVSPPSAQAPGGKRDPWFVASCTAGLVLLGLALVFGRDAGIIWDEGFQRQYGIYVLAWFRSGFRDRSALGYIDLYLYGGLFDATAQWFVERLPFDAFDTRHLLTTLTALFGIAGTWKIGAALGGGRAGFFAAATLALTPTLIGHGLFNPKDIPFATAAVFTTLAAIRIALGPWPVRVGDVLSAGVAVGLALAVRPAGLFLLSYPWLAFALRGIAEHRARKAVAAWSYRGLAHGVALLSAGSVLAWLLMLSAWPWAQVEPLSRPFEAMRIARHFSWDGYLLFDGALVSARDLPWTYLPTWFAVTLPEIYLIGFGCGLAWLALAVKARMRGAVTAQGRGIGVSMLVVSAFLPLIAACITRPVLYDAQRHFLFLYPPLAALAGLALAEITADSRIPTSVRRAVLGAWVVLALMVAIEIVQLHPYEYVYFNRLEGGLPAAVGRFETDYWGASYKEGLAWLVQHARPLRADHKLRVASCDEYSNARLYYYLQSWPGVARRFEVEPDPEKSDVFLAVTRYGCHLQVAGKILHVVQRQGAPLLYVLRVGASAGSPH